MNNLCDQLISLSAIGSLSFCSDKQAIFNTLDKLYSMVFPKNKKIILNTAKEYGPSENIIVEYFNSYPERRKYFFIVSSIGIYFSDINNPYMNPEKIKESALVIIDALNPEAIMLHRLNPSFSENEIINSYKILYDLQIKKKVSYIGISEANSRQWTVVINEFGNYNLITEIAYNAMIKRAEKNGIMDIIKKNNILTLTYSNAMRGFFNCNNYVDNKLDLNKLDEMTRSIGFFSPEYFDLNQQIIINFMNYSKILNMDPVHLMLSYVATKGLIGIFDTTNISTRLESNIYNTKILSDNIMEIIDNITIGFDGNPNPSILNYLDDLSLNNYQ